MALFAAATGRVATKIAKIAEKQVGRPSHIT